ncbi:rubredoxin rubA [Mycobacterium tuberculosis T92]|nr:rubredoxin rubA [Mycobacterium tuberculosis T92]
MAAYRCPVCDYVYDEANGDARERLPSRHRLGSNSRRLVLPGLRVREKVDFEKIGG